MDRCGNALIMGRWQFPLRPAVAAALAVGALLAGCVQAPKSMYQWDKFQPQLYQHFKGDGSGPAEQLLVLEEQAQKAQAEGRPLPPGFRAHLAMIYLRLGQQEQARVQLESEKASFPESAHYMDFLLKRMSSPNVSKQRRVQSNDKS